MSDAWWTESLKKEQAAYEKINLRNKNSSGALSVVLDPIGVPSLQPSRKQTSSLGTTQDSAPCSAPNFQPPPIEAAVSVIGSATHYPKKSQAGSARDTEIGERLAVLESELREERRRSRVAEEALKKILAKS